MSIDFPFHLIQEEVYTNHEGTMTLGQAMSEKRYRVLQNDAGQILLDPIDPIPEQEQWLWQNSQAQSLIRRGIEQIAAGERRSLGSFAQYADLEIED